MQTCPVVVVNFYRQGGLLGSGIEMGLKRRAFEHGEMGKGQWTNGTDCTKTGRVDHLPNSHWMILALIGYAGDEGRKGAWALTAKIKVCSLWVVGSPGGF